MGRKILWPFFAYAANAAWISLSVALVSSPTNALAQPCDSLDSPDFFSAGSTPVPIEAADLDGDGDQDLVVGNRDAKTISVLLGNGHGGFAAAVPYVMQADGQVYGIALGDLNNDGRPDVIAGQYAGSTQYVTRRLNIGGGQFGDLLPPLISNGASPHQVIIVDLDMDGKKDIVTRCAGGPVDCFRNLGNNQFGTPESIAVESSGQGVTAGDLDGDGFPELLVTDHLYTGSTTGKVFVFSNDGTGHFDPPVSYATGAAPVYVELAELNGDGNLDFVTATYTAHQHNTLTLYFGDGAGGFSNRTDITGYDFSVDVVPADLDGDGDLDLFVTATETDRILIYWNDGAANFGQPTALSIGNGNTHYQAIAVDLNSDGGADIAAACFNGAGVRVWLGCGGFEYDCNNNSIPDDLDILDGFSDDCDLNGIPDECETVDCDKPDLRVEPFNIPTSGMAGQTIELQFTIRNHGEGPAVGPWTDRVFYSLDNQVGDDVSVGSFTFNGTLAPGESQPRTVPITLPGAPGIRRIVVTTEADDVIDEGTAEANNATISSGAINVLAVPMADLVVENLSTPPNNITSGSVTSVSWEVRNAGTGSTASSQWVDEVFISQNPNLTFGGPSGDQDLCNEQLAVYAVHVGNAAYLDDGNSYSQSVSLSLPHNVFGNFYVYVIADRRGCHHVTGDVPELNDTNNLARSGSFDVVLEEQADLLATNIIADSIAATSGYFSVSWKDRNDGAGDTDTGAWTDAVYFSTNATPAITPGDILLGVRHRSGPPLEGGVTDPVTSFTTLLPATLGASYNVKLALDIDDVVSEIGPHASNDNVFVHATSVEITQTPPINLRPTQIESPVTLGAPGHPIRVRYHVVNDGAPRTNGLSWVDRVYLSVDTTLSPATDTLLGSDSHSTQFENGAYSLVSYEGEVNSFLPNNFAAGFYYVIVKVDAADVVDEGAGELNNVLSSAPFQIQLSPTDLQIAPGQPMPGSAPAGQSLTARWQVTNTGSAVTPVIAWSDAVYYSDDAVLSAGDQLLAAKSHGNLLAAGATYSGNTSITLPASATAGPRHLIFVTDVHNAVYEQSPGETNNVTAFPITITPAGPAFVADLTPTIISAPTEIQADQSFDIEFTVANSGNIATTATTWLDRIYASADLHLGPEDVLLKQIIHNGALAQQATYTVNTPVTVSGMNAGPIHLFVLVDATGQVFEAVESNNSRSTPTTVAGTPQQFANLVATHLVAPATANANGQITVIWRVANLGEAATPNANWRDSVYLSSDATLDAGDVLIGSKQHTAPLSIGEEREFQDSFLIPCGVAGPRRLIVLTDSQNVVLEGDREQDNVRIMPTVTQITAQQDANLQIQSVATLVSPSAGQVANFTWTAANVGGNPCMNSWSDAVFLSRDTLLDPGLDVFLGTYTYMTPLLAGESRIIAQSYLIPPELFQSYYVIVKADYNAQLAESSEDDNVRSSLASVQITQTAPGDLQVAGVQVPGNSSPGQIVQFSWADFNAGGGAVAGAWSNSVYLSSNPIWDIDDVFVDRFDFSPVTIATQLSQPRSESAVLPGVKPGTYHVIVKADVLNQIPETSNSNNTGVSVGMMTVNVQPLPLGITVPAQLAAGDSRYFALQVSAGLTVRINLTHTSSTAWTTLYVKKNEVPTSGNFDFTSDQSDNSSQEIVIPTTEAATYYILARAMAGTAAPDGETMFIVANSLPFGVDSVLPLRAGNGDRVTFRIAGSQFQTGATVTLIGANNLTLTPAEVKWVDGQRLRARFNLTGAPYGPYVVRVTNPGGDSEEPLDPVIVEPALPVSASISGEGELTPRAGGVFPANAAILNTSNVDAPMVTVMARVYGDVRIGWSRPAESLPRVADFPMGMPWESNSPTASFSNGHTHDAFHLRDLAPGESMHCTALVSQFQEGPINFQFGARAESLDQFTSTLFGKLESARQTLVNENISNLSPELQAVIHDPAGWQTHFEGILAGLGYFEPGPHPQTTFGCIGMAGCAGQESLKALILEAVRCAPLGPYAPLCTALKVLHYSHGMIECYQRHCSPMCETCVDGVYQWNSCSFVDVLGSYFHSISQGCGEAIAAIDPNEKIGPTGGGGQQMISGAGLQYSIHFENQPEAQGSAGLVEITDDLDQLLNPGSVRLGAVRIGDFNITEMQGRISFSKTYNLTAEKGIYLRIFAGVDASSRRVIWRFESIDPVTGVAPNNPNVGILPPNTVDGVGTGFVQFQVSASPGAGTGSPVRNGAKIKFDSQPVILTNIVTHILDGDRPSSAVVPLPSVSSNPQLPLTWTGTDTAGGSQLAGFTIYAAVSTTPQVHFDSNLALPIAGLVDTLEQSTIFPALPGRQYYFFSTARDAAGNEEPRPSVADAITYVPLAIPAAPTVTGRTSVTVNLQLPFDSSALNNPLDAEYALLIDALDKYVDATGRPTDVPTWRTAAAWTSSFTVRALHPSRPVAFAIRARNGFETLPLSPIVLTSTRARGDVNGDGAVNQMDIDFVEEHLGSIYGQFNFDPAADVNGDDAVNALDLAIVQDAVLCGGVMPGDLDGNGIANAADIPGFIGAVLNPAAQDACAADVSGDGVVDGLDVKYFVDALH